MILGSTSFNPLLLPPAGQGGQDQDQKNPEWFEDCASKLRFLKFLASNENERCLVKDSSTMFCDEVFRDKFLWRIFATMLCDEVSRRSFATKFHDEVSWQSFVLKIFFDLKCLNVLTETAACVFWLSRHAACCGNRPSIKQIIYHENNIRNLFSICLLNDIESNSFWRNLISPVPNISTVFFIVVLDH